MAQVDRGRLGINSGLRLLEWKWKIGLGKPLLYLQNSQCILVYCVESM